MIECAACDFFPAFGVVTLRTLISKTAAMRVLMTRRAVRKRQTGVLHKRRNRFIAGFFARRFFEMTLRARHEFMPAREHELRALVRKFCRGFPAGVVMTTRAIFTKLAAMLIAMTAQTILRKPEESFCDTDRRVSRELLMNILGLMASATLCLRMLAFQNVSRLAMIETSLALLPTNQSKLHAVMIAMTRGAEFRLFSRALCGCRSDARVKASVVLHALRDRNMAFQAFCIARLLPHFMAGETLRQAFELRVRPTERPR